MSSFADLKSSCPGIIVPGTLASGAQAEEPVAALERVQLLGEHVIRCILAFEGLEDRDGITQTDRLNTLSNRGLLPSTLLPFFHAINETSQTAGMPPAALQMRVALTAKLAERLATWFAKSYGPQLSVTAKSASNAESAIKAIRESTSSDGIRRSARESAARRANTMQLGEDETRVLIDFQLRAAGWQTDTWAIRHSQGARPEKGSNKAIAEWPTETGPADYALFSGLDLVGVVEAKKMGKDVIAHLKQSKRYSHGITLDAEARFVGGPWEDYRVPFLFSTNARPYLDQLKEKSGIWFLDARCPTNHPRPLLGWYSPEELLDLLQQDVLAAEERLANEPLDYLGLRDYQQKAIRRIESALDQGQSRLSWPWRPELGKPSSLLGSSIG
ncbi:MAG TPA: hypothetical protein VMW38_27810 [Terriglobia bacterium]|nr:hypothetical protein [Terriglobia bacterium]